MDILTYALMENARTMTTEGQCQVSAEVMNCAPAGMLSIGAAPARPFTIPRRAASTETVYTEQDTVAGNPTPHPSHHLEVTLSGTHIEAGLATSAIYDRRAVSPGRAADITPQPANRSGHKIRQRLLARESVKFGSKG